MYEHPVARAERLARGKSSPTGWPVQRLQRPADTDVLKILPPRSPRVPVWADSGVDDEDDLAPARGFLWLGAGTVVLLIAVICAL